MIAFNHHFGKLNVHRRTLSPTSVPVSKLVSVFFFALFFVGCESPSSTEGDVSKPVVQPVRVPDEALGRAGSVTMELPEFRQAIAEARALQEWRSGKAAPLTALENMMLRRRVLTRGLETRVVRAEARKRNLTPDIKVVNALLAQAAAGLVVGERHNELVDQRGECGV